MSFKDIPIADPLDDEVLFVEDRLEELTTEERIGVLKGIKELLGPNGERWSKTAWFGRPLGEEDSFSPGDEAQAVEPNYATTWCLLGAAEEVGFRLGITRKRLSATRFGPALSLAKLLEQKKGYLSVYKFNDSESTSWEDVRELLDERLAQLEEGSP